MTLLIILLTIIVSVIAFKRNDLFNKWSLIPHQIVYNHKYFQLFSSGFIHSGWAHLAINMLVLWSFGENVESFFVELFQNPLSGKIFFLLFYLSAIPIASIAAVIKHRHHPEYMAVGASGAVSAVVFCSIIFDPLSKLIILPIPIPIPAILFGIAYLIYSWYMSRNSNDNIGHDTHFWGAIYGIIIPLAIEPTLGLRFFNIILHVFQ